MNLTWHDVGIVYRQSNHLGFGSRDVDRYNSFWSIIKVAIVSPWIGQRDSSLWESMGKSSLIWVESKWYKIWMTKWLKPKQENWLNSLWNDSSSWIFVQVSLPRFEYQRVWDISDHRDQVLLFHFKRSLWLGTDGVLVEANCGEIFGTMKNI